MTRFKIGDRVILEGVIEEMDSSDLPLKVRYGGDVGAYEWIQDGPHIHHVRHDIGLLPMQLEAVTKERDDARDRVAELTRIGDEAFTEKRVAERERDDAREQLARVCAQVETMGAELKAVKAELTDEYNGRTNAMNECVILREQRDTACAGERSADMEVERLRALLNQRSKDARILDCVATLLAMRGAP